MATSPYLLRHGVNLQYVSSIEEQIDACLVNRDYEKSSNSSLTMIKIVIKCRLTENERKELANRYTHAGWVKVECTQGDGACGFTLFTTLNLENA